MTSSARLSDKHVCPLPGHGTPPIASASGDVNINFMGSARVGDTCGVWCSHNYRLSFYSGKRPPHGPLRKPNKSRRDDTPDRISIGIGVQLYKEQPNGGITAKMVMDKVLAVSPT